MFFLSPATTWMLDFVILLTLHADSIVSTNWKNLLRRIIQNPKGFFVLLFNLPKLTKLYFRLLADKRIPLRLKLIVVAAVFYVLSPFDIVPDFIIPFVGYVDDIVILIFALQYFLKKCPPEIVYEHVQKIETKARN